MSPDETEPAPLTSKEIDRWAREMDALCADSDPKDEARMLAAIEEHRQWAKERARREMGLSS
jgi:hypothetical protein